MIKATILYSDIDNLVVTYFVFGVGAFFLLYWLKKILNYNKHSRDIVYQNSNSETDLNNYTFNFNNEAIISKKTSLLTKVILFSLSSIIAVLPFYEFVETLRPEVYKTYWTCLLH